MLLEVEEFGLNESEASRGEGGLKDDREGQGRREGELGSVWDTRKRSCWSSLLEMKRSLKIKPFPAPLHE